MTIFGLFITWDPDDDMLNNYAKTFLQSEIMVWRGAMSATGLYFYPNNIIVSDAIMRNLEDSNKSARDVLAKIYNDSKKLCIKHQKSLVFAWRIMVNLEPL